MKGYELRLQEFCEFCPDFKPSVDKVDCSDVGCTRFINSIHCINQERCRTIAANLKNRVTTNGG